MSHQNVDLLVIGAGPAGSLVASLVRRENPERRVLVIEKETFPRHHIGESSIPSWRNILDRAGVLAKLESGDFMRKVGTLFQWGAEDDERWTIDFRDRTTGGASPGSYQVDRASFDHALLLHARSLGAEVLEGATARTAQREDGGFHVTWERGGQIEDAHTRFLIDASGQARVLSRLWGLRLIPFDDMNNFAVYGYWQGSRIAQFAGPPAAEHERWTYITTSPDGWVWHIPIHPDLVSVGLVTDASVIPAGGIEALEEVYLRNVRSAAGVDELLSAARLVQHPLARSRLMTIRDWAYHVETVCGPGWMLVGDAAAFVDPILSSGMLIAANGASMAANVLNTIWKDPSVDVPLLHESYQAAYDDMAESYHRLARVWYTRNFKYKTWHWEAKRQRLRTGRHPASETDAAAFLQLCIGSFANPVEGTFADRGVLLDFMRPDAYIYAAHLFRGETSLEGVDREGEDEEGTRLRIEARSRQRWCDLLFSHVSMEGAVAKIRDGYFTDSTMSHWQRVRYLELRDDPSLDAFDRVVFPVHPDLPEGILPHLSRARRLRDLLRDLCAARPSGSTEYQVLLRLAQQQILQLDLRGWLRVEPAEQSDGGSPNWPAALIAALRAIPDARVEMDLLGDSLHVHLTPAQAPQRAWLVLTSGARADPKYVWKRTRSTAFGYRGDLAVVGPVAERIGRSFAAWEREDPAGATAWWELDAPRLAGDSIAALTRAVADVASSA